MNDSTKVTFSQVYQDFKEALSGAAEALKTGSEHVYEVLVWQQVVNAITYSLVIVILGFTAFRLVTSGLKHGKGKDGDWEWNPDTPAIPFTIIGGVLTLITVITLAVSISDIVMGFLNPEYGAIQEVRDFIRRY